VLDVAGRFKGESSWGRLGRAGSGGTALWVVSPHGAVARCEIGIREPRGVCRVEWFLTAIVVLGSERGGE